MQKRDGFETSAQAMMAMRLADRVERLEYELSGKPEIVVTIAADFLHGGPPTFARIFDRPGFKLATIQKHLAGC